jgi:hypothetical protein
MMVSRRTSVKKKKKEKKNKETVGILLGSNTIGVSPVAGHINVPFGLLFVAKTFWSDRLSILFPLS